MSPPVGSCRVAAAAYWNADSGPPRAELLSRAERTSAGFSVRILAHVLGELWSNLAVGSRPRTWVQGITDLADAETLPRSPLARVLEASVGPVLVHAGPAVVPMALLEGMALLEEHDAVLVAFSQDAVEPHHEAVAAALVLTRESPSPALVLYPPVLRRTSSHLGPNRVEDNSLAVIDRIVRAIKVGQPTIETVAHGDVDHGGRWCIELRAAD